MKKWIAALAIGAVANSAGWAAGSYLRTTVAAIRAGGDSGARLERRVSFEATTLYYRGYENRLFVQDGNTGIFILAPGGLGLEPGDRIEVDGVTAGDFRPMVRADRVVLLDRGKLPQPVEANYDQLIRSERDCTLIRTRGVVRAADPARGANGPTYLQMLTPGGYIDAVLDSDDSLARRRMLDAEVEITGVATARLDGKAQQTGVKLYVPSLDDVRILSPGQVDPATLPITPMDAIINVRRVEDRTPRVRVHGSITYAQPGSLVVLEAAGQSLRVITQSDTPVRIGDVADATGFPDVQDGFLALTRGEIRDTGMQAPMAAEASTWDDLANSRHIFDLVSVVGSVVAEVRSAGQNEYVIDSGGHLFSAIYRLPDLANQEAAAAAKRAPIGSQVRVTGICMLKSANPFDGQVPFDLLLRSPDDVVVMARPSPLTVGNLMILVGLLTIVLLAGGGWVWTLRRKVRRKAAELATRIAADARLERQRSRILEDINGGRPLPEIMEEIAELVSANLGGAACWCELADGSSAGHAASADSSQVIREEIPAHKGAPHGAIFAVSPARSFAVPKLAIGARLAALAVETRGLYSDLVHRSEFDLLTDIHNRFSFDTCLDAQIAAGARFGLIFIDLDRFKQVNDRCGHQAGDRYLREAALRMQGQLRPGDLLARLGGDEFGALIRAVRNRGDVEEVAHRLEEAFAHPFTVHGAALHGSASFGIAVYPDNGCTRDELMLAADAAMYQAKYARRTLENTGS